MKATIWHNPACGTSRKTLAILQERDGVDLTVVEYLKNPPSRDKLAQLYADAGMTPAEGLRLRGTDAEERGLPDADDATVLAAMAAGSPALLVTANIGCQTHLQGGSARPVRHWIELIDERLNAGA